MVTKGIARTMKLETYLNAYDSSLEDANWCEGRIQINSTFFFQYKRRVRQYRVFRARILRIDAEKDVQISQMMELVRIVDNLRKNRLNSDYIFAMDLAKMLIQREA